MHLQTHRYPRNRIPSPSPCP